MSPLLANIALSVFDQHVHGPWQPGGVMSNRIAIAPPSQEGSAELADRPRGRFAVLVFGSRDDVNTLREEIVEVLAPLGLWFSGTKTRVVHMSEGSTSWVPHPVETQARYRQVVRLRVHRRSAHPVAEGQDSCPDQQVVAAATQGRVGPAQPDHARLVQLLQICRRQERYAIPGHLRGYRIARWWLRLHRWSWADLRRHLIGPNGRWRMPSADGVALFNLGRVPTARYRYRGNKIPNPWTVANPA